MLFHTDYRKPFWQGFFHAVLVSVYCFFLSLVVLSLQRIYNGEISVVIQYTFSLFLIIVSVAVAAWLIFYEPMKKLLHRRFKQATVMLASTLGWLFIFMIIFLLGLVFSLPMT